MMLDVTSLLRDAELQVSEFSGGRLKTAKLYKQLLSGVAEPYVELAILLGNASKVQSDSDTKADLLKMIEVNYNHFKNKPQVDHLMEKYNLDSSMLKPLQKVV